MKNFLFLFFIIIFQVPVIAIACGENDGGFFFCREGAWDNLASATLVSKNKNDIFRYRFGDSSTQIEAESVNRFYRFILLKPKIYIYNKNASLEKGYELDPVEGLMGNLKLITVLLNSSFPNGPASIKNKKIIRLGSPSKELEIIVDPGTVGRYGAPWSANGYILPIGDFKFRFSLAIKCLDRSNTQRIINMSGELDYSKKNFELPDSFDLKDFSIINYNKTELNVDNVKTIGELKKRIPAS